MKQYFLFCFLGFLQVAALSCASKNLDSEKQKSPVSEGESLPGVSPQTNATWSEDMRDLEKELTQLLPLALDAKKFKDEKSQAQIQKSLANLKAKAQKVNHSPMTQIADPSLGFISYDFKDQAELIESSFLEGKKEFARYNLIHITSYCIECHTRNSVGPSFGSEKMSAQLQSKSLFDQAAYLAAVRQFDLAVEKYKSFLISEKANSVDLKRFEESLHNILSITIKYKKSPQEALKVLELIDSKTDFPYYLQKSMGFWQGDLKEWAGEKKPKISLKSIKLRLEVFQKRKFDQGPLAGEVLLLRSLSDLHDIINKSQSTDQKAETLYLLGWAYSEDSNNLMMNLDEKYFETCIRKFQKTSWAQKCYQKLEEITYAAYSGSAGVFIPPDVKLKLQQLKLQTGL